MTLKELIAKLDGEIDFLENDPEQQAIAQALKDLDEELGNAES